jgi:nitrogen fixation protein
MPAGKEPHALEPCETGKELVGDLEPGSTHVHEAGFWEIGQRPETRDRKDGGSFSAVVAGCQRNRLTGFVTQQDARLPVVQVSEPDAVGKLQNGDDLLRHAWELSLPRRARGFKSCFANLRSGRAKSLLIWH